MTAMIVKSGVPLATSASLLAASSTIPVEKSLRQNQAEFALQKACAQMPLSGRQHFELALVYARQQRELLADQAMATAQLLLQDDPSLAWPIARYWGGPSATTSEGDLS